MKCLLPSMTLAAAIVTLFPSSHAQAAILSFATTLNGANESPANASPGTGTASIAIDNIANTLRLQVTFSGLAGTTRNSHVHDPTDVVAINIPGFPLGVQSGSYDNLFDLTLASSYYIDFITANGGTAATAQAALTSHLEAGTAYLNIHSQSFINGEISGFFLPVTQSTPVPEPSYILGIFGALGAGSILKRKIE
jgi:CHRD domain